MKTPLLDRIVEVMAEVAKAELPVHMYNFYKGDWPEIGADIHTCGTAACICGYAALDKEVQEIVGSNNPGYVWDAASDETNAFLTSSMFDSAATSRWINAKSADLPEHIIKMNHLNTDEPTAQDAYEYVKAVRDYLNGEAQ